MRICKFMTYSNYFQPHWTVQQLADYTCCPLCFIYNRDLRNSLPPTGHSAVKITVNFLTRQSREQILLWTLCHGCSWIHQSLDTLSRIYQLYLNFSANWASNRANCQLAWLETGNYHCLQCDSAFSVSKSWSLTWCQNNVHWFDRDMCLQLVILLHVCLHSLYYY